MTMTPDKWHPGAGPIYDDEITQKMSKNAKGSHGGPMPEWWRKKIGEGKRRNAALRKANLPQ